MNQKISLLTILLILTMGALHAQIGGLSNSLIFTKTEVGQMAIFGPSSTEYKKIQPEIFLVFELIENQGQYVYMHLDPLLAPYTLFGEGKPPLLIPTSNPTNPTLKAVDYNIVNIDWERPIMFKRSNFNIDLGFSFFWKIEGLNSEEKLYQGMIRSDFNLQRQSDYAYGSGRFASRSRVGFGPILAAKYVDNYDKFAIRVAVSSGWYGPKAGTYNFAEFDGFYALSDKVAISLKMKNFIKLFSHQHDDFTQEFQDLMTERLGDQLRVKNKEYSIGLILNIFDSF
ncbi:MAG: hypothetical protein RIC35_00205 [Marinoscillum sp.]